MSESNHSTTPSSEAQRDEEGQFVAGNAGGPGNPFARQVAALRKAALHAVSENDVADVVRMLLEKAKAGNLPAAKLLFQYTVGKPAPAVEPDRMSFDEWQRLSETVGVAGSIRAIAKAGEPDYLLTLAGALREVVTDKIAYELNEKCEEFKKPMSQRERKREKRRRERARRAAAPSPNGDIYEWLGEPSPYGADPELDALLGGARADA
jgi:hypothetical protein